MTEFGPVVFWTHEQADDHTVIRNLTLFHTILDETKEFIIARLLVTSQIVQQSHCFHRLQRVKLLKF